jgi:hypothetical protein
MSEENVNALNIKLADEDPENIEAAVPPDV